MSFEPLLWFALGRMAFGLVDRFSWKFIVIELSSIGLFLLVGSLLLRVSPPAVMGLGIGGVFLVTAVCTRLIVARDPVELVSSAGTEKPIRLGIIDFAWLSIIAGTLAITAFARSAHPLTDVSPTGPLAKEFVQAELSNTMFLLGKTIDSVFILGGVVAACMAILWAGELWRQHDGDSRQHYRVTTVSAIRMVVAFFIVILNALYWVGVPLYTRANNLAALLK